MLLTELFFRGLQSQEARLLEGQRPSETKQVDVLARALKSLGFDLERRM